MHAVDSTKGKCAQEWAQTTGRHETLQRIQRLLQRPRAEQCCLDYGPEGPGLQAAAPASDRGGENLARRIKHTLGCVSPQEPRDDGALDLMVRMTSGVRSPLVATACRPLCPSSPPQVGKRRLAVAELLARHSSKELEEGSVCHSNGSVTSASPRSSQSACLTSCCQEPKESSGGMRGLMPRGMTRQNNIYPSGCVPKIELTKSGEPTPKKEKKKKRQKGYLEPPIWKYKEAKEEKKREKKKQEKEKEEQDKKVKESKRISKKKGH